MVLPAEQVVDGLVCSLADDVPERYLDGAQDGCELEARVPKVVTRGVHLVPNALNVERALTDDVQTCHLVDERNLGFQVAQPVGVGVAGDPLAESGDALIGLHLEKQQVSAPSVWGEILYHHRLDVCDFHFDLLCFKLAVLT